jgi:hypothetical protein
MVEQSEIVKEIGQEKTDEEKDELKHNQPVC